MKSDRALWTIFFLTLSVVLFVLFLLFGQKPSGPPIDPTSSTNFGDLGELDDEELDRPRIYTGTHLSGAGSYQAPSTRPIEERQEPPASSYGNIHSNARREGFRKRSDKFHPSLKDGFTPRARLPLEKRQEKLRKQLEAKGFKNQEYIKMRLLALNDAGAEEALARAHQLAEEGRVEEALNLLKEEFENTDPANLEVRGILVQTIVGLASFRGYPDTASNYTRQLNAIRSQVNHIKMNTILINNPVAMESLRAEREALNLMQTNEEAPKEGLEYMKKNRGLPREAWVLMRGASLGMLPQFSDPKATTEIPKAFRKFEESIHKNWADPKE